MGSGRRFGAFVRAVGCGPLLAGRGARLVVSLLVAGLVWSGLTVVLVAGGVAPARAVPVAGTGGEFVPVAGRIMDTATGLGGYTTNMAPNVWRTLKVAGALGGLPATGISAVQVTLSVLNPSELGNVYLAPDGQASSSVSSLVFSPTGTASNTAIVAVPANGVVKVLANKSVRLIVDVQGYFTAGNTAAGGFVPVTPSMVVDTRVGSTTVSGLPQAKLSPGTVNVTLAGRGGVPADASAVMVNFTVINYASVTGNAPYISPYPKGSAFPGTTLDFPDRVGTTSIGATVPLDPATGGVVSIRYAATAGSTIDLLMSVSGYYTPAVASGAFTPVQSRLLAAVPVAANATVTKILAGTNGIPVAGSGITALALNVTVGHASSNTGGWLGMNADDQDSYVWMVNYVPSTTRSNFATVSLGPDGGIHIKNASNDPVTVWVDLQGWYTSLADQVVAGGQGSTQRAVGLQARPTPSAPSTPVIYRYRAGLTDPFTTVPLGDLSDGDGNPPGGWPLAPSGSGGSGGSATFAPYS